MGLMWWLFLMHWTKRYVVTWRSSIRIALRHQVMLSSKHAKTHHWSQRQVGRVWHRSHLELMR